MLPPVDVHLNAPHVVDSSSFRNTYGIEDSDVLLVTVSGLTDWMKAESLLRTIDAVRTLGRTASTSCNCRRRDSSGQAAATGGQGKCGAPA